MNFNYNIRKRDVLHYTGHLLVGYWHKPLMLAMYSWIFVFLAFCSPTHLVIKENKLIDNKEYHTFKKDFKWLNFGYYKHLKRYSEANKVPVELGLAIIQVESGGKNVRGKLNKNGTYDYGLAQVNQIHVRDPRILFNTKFNIAFMFYYLNKCRSHSNENIKHTIRMYNQGTHGNQYQYKRWNYVSSVLYYYTLALKTTKNVNF